MHFVLITKPEFRYRYWHDIELGAEYVVVTNDLIAQCGDRHDLLVPMYENESEMHVRSCIPLNP
ncbi:hypothetical protein VCO01S_27070 [Vibrio comitans NBRC 102076]|uniref:Uncharacterized protein n=1 Tax=Vibrio comitans NBRC 102076 TaxID=1219078 RepID=A0A4Y3IRK5_9VIBR|nr:hypothetical protein VCO01S_27070 [Vibrio comitans NBRC 102076]